MKKITEMKDITIDNRKNTEKTYTFGGSMTKNDFVVLPADDPVRGLFGCLVFEKENESNSLIYEQKVYDDCEVINCEDAESFFYALQFSISSNYPTFMHDQPQHLRVGFISLRNDCNRYYSLSLLLYKEYFCSKKSEENKEGA